MKIKDIRVGDILEEYPTCYSVRVLEVSDCRVFVRFDTGAEEFSSWVLPAQLSPLDEFRSGDGE